MIIINPYWEYYLLLFISMKIEAIYSNRFKVYFNGIYVDNLEKKRKRVCVSNYNEI